MKFLHLIQYLSAVFLSLGLNRFEVLELSLKECQMQAELSWRNSNMPIIELQKSASRILIYPWSCVSIVLSILHEFLPIAILLTMMWPKALSQVSLSLCHVYEDNFAVWSENWWVPWPQATQIIDLIFGAVTNRLPNSSDALVFCRNL